jgi:acyl transferase domain-containing protein
VLDDAYHYMKNRGLNGNTFTQSLEKLPAVSDLLLSSESRMLQLSKPHKTMDDPDRETSDAKLFVFSAKDEQSLAQSAKNYAAHVSRLETDSIKCGWTRAKCDEYLTDLAYTLGSRRSLLSTRSYVIADSIEELKILVPTISQFSTQITSASRIERLGFIFTGQGAQWPQMGAQLLKYPVFYESLRQAEEFLQQLHCPWRLIGRRQSIILTAVLGTDLGTDELLKREGESNVHLPEYSQTICTAIQVALIDLLHSFGIKSSVSVGHSSGEIAAACVLCFSCLRSC